MSPTDQTDETQAVEPASYGYCCWHGGDAEGVQLIDVIEQGTGSGGVLFACPRCRERHQLIPLADRP